MHILTTMKTFTLEHNNKIQDLLPSSAFMSLDLLITGGVFFFIIFGSFLKRAAWNPSPPRKKCIYGTKLLKHLYYVSLTSLIVKLQFLLCFL